MQNFERVFLNGFLWSVDFVVFFPKSLHAFEKSKMFSFSLFVKIVFQLLAFRWGLNSDASTTQGLHSLWSDLMICF